MLPCSPPLQLALRGGQGAAGPAATLPPKKVFGNKDRNFILERQKGLDVSLGPCYVCCGRRTLTLLFSRAGRQTYLQTLLTHPTVKHLLPLKRFLDPHNYARDFHEEAMAGVAMFLRSEASWEIVEQLPQIGWASCCTATHPPTIPSHLISPAIPTPTNKGWRIRKHHFVVRCHNDTANDARITKVLSWVPTNAGLRSCAKAAPSEVRSRAIHYLAGIVHPFIQPAVLGTIHESAGGSAAIVIRELNAKVCGRAFFCGWAPSVWGLLTHLWCVTLLFLSAGLAEGPHLPQQGTEELVYGQVLRRKVQGHRHPRRAPLRAAGA